MGRAIEDFLREADEIIEKKASESRPPVATMMDDEVVKMASLLSAKEAPAASQFELSPFEKIAQAVAVVETIQNLDKLEKIAQFETMCKEKGLNDEQIAQFLEKRGFKEVSKYVIPPAIAGLAGMAYGHHKGKEKGYKNALDDVQNALSSQ